MRPLSVAIAIGNTLRMFLGASLRRYLPFVRVTIVTVWPLWYNILLTYVIRGLLVVTAWGADERHENFKGVGSVGNLFLAVRGVG